MAEQPKPETTSGRQRGEADDGDGDITVQRTPGKAEGEDPVEPPPAEDG